MDTDKKDVLGCFPNLYQQLLVMMVHIKLSYILEMIMVKENQSLNRRIFMQGPVVQVNLKNLFSETQIHQLHQILKINTLNFQKDYQPNKTKLLRKDSKIKQSSSIHHALVTIFCKRYSNNRAKASYQYVQDKRPELDPKRNREEDGRVKSKLRNFYSNQQSTVVTSYFKPLKHMEDPYDRAHKIALEKQKKDKSLEGQAKFRPNSYHSYKFSKDKNVFDISEEMKFKKPKQTKFNIYNHENKWKTCNPNKHGHYGSLGPFPKYMENPPRQITRKSQGEKKETFKSMSSSLTRPTPSVTKNSINMRRYTGSHSFSLHK